MAEFHIAWVDDTDVEIADQRGIDDAQEAARIAARGLVQDHRRAARALVYQGVSPQAGEVVAVVERHQGPHPI